MSGIKILGTGQFVPPFIATNDDFTFIETSDDWITTRTGMKERHIAQGEPTWYMGSLAAKEAMKTAKVAPNDIDMVLVTTVTPDFYTPATACIIQKHLGIKDAMALDINVACTGFAFGLDMARRYLAAGDIKHILLISAESLSSLLTTKTAVLVCFLATVPALVL